ncbi:hypothetical protein CPAV1605_8 [seawater metagenome]|uniref:2OG-Fe(II) oxygenase superfamily n=1 Tax=seawater metagenome TaxID=1561972 RepID=A0A5E8CFN3_9ZZZZ
MNRNLILIILIILFVITTYNSNIKERARKLANKPSDKVYLIPNFLDDEIFLDVQNLIEKDYDENKKLYYRSQNYMRSGCSRSHVQAKKTNLEKVFKLIKNSNTLNKIQNEAKLNLQFVPGTDPNQISVLIYDKENDGIDWHYDSSEYHGNRWSAILIISNQGYNTKYSSSSFMYKANQKTVSLKGMENNLLLFQGNRIKHKISKLLKGEKRIVISMVLCDICTPSLSILSLIKQKFINFFFYG